MVLRLWRACALAAVAGAMLAVACAGPSRVPPPPLPAGPTVLVGAGDIAVCGSPGSEATARLIDGIAGQVFTAGDNAYPSGTASNYRNCYDPTWGRHRSRTRPAPGNHEYDVSGAAAYYDYFGDSAGPRGLGYYAYPLGPWQVVVLNSEIDIRAGSAQLVWLRDELTVNPYYCTVAIWHRPLFTGGPNGPNPDTREIWRVLYDLNVDVIVNGHDHLYERFAPQNPAGQADATRGIRQFTVGTGGATLYPFVATRPMSEVRLSAWGVLVLRLSEGAYEWQFVPIAGATVTDSGTGRCH